MTDWRFRKDDLLALILCLQGRVWHPGVLDAFSTTFDNITGTTSIEKMWVSLWMSKHALIMSSLGNSWRPELHTALGNRGKYINHRRR